MRRQTPSRSGEDGYLLLGAIVAVFFVLLALSVAAPIVAKDLRREREVETVRRGNQYVRALQLYYRKFNSYPGSMDALEKSNNIRFLRQKYIDPMTGKSDWRMIKVGENKTTVKGFFGKPLTGLPGAGLGSAAGMASSGAIGAGAAGSSASSFGSSSFGSSSTPAAGATAAGATTSTDGSTGAAGASGAAGSTGTGSSLGSLATSSIGGAFMGVGLPKSGSSVITLNEQTTYQTWEFLYDPRVEMLKAQANLLGGPASTGAGSLGSASGLASPTSGTGAGGTGTTGSGTGFGSGFGSTPSTGTGTTPASGTGTTTPQQ
jgi:hypothetical protein